MLYLNIKQVFINERWADLTLTSVVFEYEILKFFIQNIDDLTLTSVVFE